MTTTGKIILLNGASSSGKSTLASGLQAALPEAFWHYSIDHLRASRVLPWQRISSGEFDWKTLRPAFFEGFHRSVAAFAHGGNNMVVEHIVEEQAWMARMLALLASVDVYFVGVHCPLEELERRETARGDRRAGEARFDFETTHRFCKYDLEVDGTRATSEVVAEVVAAWRARSRPSAFERMRGNSDPA